MGEFEQHFVMVCATAGMAIVMVVCFMMVFESLKRGVEYWSDPATTTAGRVTFVLTILLLVVILLVATGWGQSVVDFLICEIGEIQCSFLIRSLL